MKLLAIMLIAICAIPAYGQTEPNPHDELSGNVTVENRRIRITAPPPTIERDTRRETLLGVQQAWREWDAKQAAVRSEVRAAGHATADQLDYLWRLEHDRLPIRQPAKPKDCDEYFAAMALDFQLPLSCAAYPTSVYHITCGPCSAADLPDYGTAERWRQRGEAAVARVNSLPEGPAKQQAVRESLMIALQAVTSSSNEDLWQRRMRHAGIENRGWTYEDHLGGHLVYTLRGREVNILASDFDRVTWSDESRIPPMPPAAGTLFQR